MKTLPKISFASFLLNGFGKAPAALFQPDYGKYPIGYRVGSPLNISVLYHPDLVQHILGKEHKHLSKNIPQTTNLRVALGEGIVSTYGNEWLEQRRKFQPFYPKTSSAEMLAEQEGIIADYVNALKQEIDKNWHSLKHAVLDCLIDLNWLQLFGTRYPGNKTEITDNIFRGNRLLAMAAADKIPVYDSILKSRLKNCHKSLRTAIKPALPTSKKAEANVSVEEVINLLLAGAVTNSGNLLFCLLHLIQDKARLAKFTDDAAYRNLILMESFRLYPAVWSLWYKAEADFNYNDFQVSKNELLVFNLYAMHRHPAWWNQPEIFNPDRFSEIQKMPDCYLPFGHGPRKCLGQHMAISILLAFLKKLTTTFDFHLKPGANIKQEFGAILFPKLSDGELQFNLKSQIHHEQLH